MTVQRAGDVPEMSRVDLWHMDGVVVSGNALAVVVNTGNAFNHHTHQNPPQQFDNLYHPVWLKKGTYTLKILYLKTAASGRVTLYVVDQQYNVSDYTGLVDMYSAVGANNQIFIDTAVVVTRDGYHRIYFTALDKNASSTGYDLLIIKTTLYRTGD